MMDNPNNLGESCGVVGIQTKDEDVSTMIFYSLWALQHRGQESSGIAVYNPREGIRLHKGMGLTSTVFDENILLSLKGKTGIGHVRYSTTGDSRLENAQPVVVTVLDGKMALAHNGDLVNAEDLRARYQEQGWSFATTTDSEIIIRLLAKYFVETKDVVKSIRRVMHELVGSYSLVLLVNGTLYAIRDPLGIRPLVVGRLTKNGGGFVVASETVVLDLLDAEKIKDVEPGEILEFKNGEKMVSHREETGKTPAHCMFEWVYFARTDSVIEGRLVYEVRKRLGASLARKSPVEADYVIPVPDSGRAHALGYSEESGIPYAEGLMKNRYVERTFIMPYQKSRDIGVKLKLNPIREVVEGKRIVLVDDSIVRGTTMKRIVKRLRDFGAKEVHVRIGSPPIIAPCYFGIDMKTRDQFVAYNRTVEEVGEVLGADSLAYVSVEELVEAIGLPREHLCLGCVTGEYPLQIPGEITRFQAKIDEFTAGSKKRKKKEPKKPE